MSLAVAGTTPTRIAQFAFPTYSRTLQLEATDDTSANVSIGDVNGDGTLYVILSNDRPDPIRAVGRNGSHGCRG